MDISYALPIIVLLLRGRRILDKVKQVSTKRSRKDDRFHLGLYGIAVNWVAVVFVVITSIFFCFPPDIPVNSSNMSMYPESVA